MELKEAIDTLLKYKKAFVFQTDITNNDYAKSVDTVLEELNNRISKEEMQNILDAVKLKREKEIEETGISLRGSAVDILENIIREKWNKE